jgi:hypothetical protein
MFVLVFCERHRALGNMVDNIDIAIMTKLNELADRFQIKAYDYVAVVRLSNQEQDSVLSFEAFPAGDTAKERRFDDMLKALNVDEHSELRTAKGIIDALDSALSRAPRLRTNA